MPGRTIAQQYEITAPPRDVFRALSEPVELTKWMLAGATLSLRAGAPYWFEWAWGYRGEGRVLRVVRDRSLTISWPHGPSRRPLGTTQVRFGVRKVRGGTLLTLRHTGFGAGPNWVEPYARSSSGWAYYLTNLKSVLESGQDLRRDGDRF